MRDRPLHDWIARELDGELSPGEHRALARRLADDAGAREAFLAWRELDHDLRRILSAESGDRAFLHGVVNGLAQDARSGPAFTRDVMKKALRSKALPACASGCRRRLALRRALGASAAALLAAAIFAGFLLRRGANGDAPVVASVAGSATLRRAGSVTPLARRMRLEPDDLIRTAGGQADVRYADGARLSIQAATELRILDGSASRTLQITAGALRADLPERGGWRALRVETPHATVETLGTLFAVSAATDATEVAVERGRVRVTWTRTLGASRTLTNTAVHDLAAGNAIRVALRDGAVHTTIRRLPPK